MKTTLVVVLVWLIALTSKVDHRENKPLYDVAVQSVVFVESKEPSGTHTGTGFVVNGHLLTCFHIIRNSTEISVTDYLGRRQKAVILKVWEDRDLVMLSVVHMPPTLYFGRPPEVNDPIWQIGNPFMFKFILSSGSFITNNEDDNIFLIDTFPGNSGSPLLNREGKVVGMTHATFGHSRITYGGTLRELYDFLR